MPEISRFYGIIISMYYKEHYPPHFHARYGEFKAEINIHDFAIKEGYLPPKALGLVMEWANKHKEELIQNWKASEEKRPLSPIEPLK